MEVPHAFGLSSRRPGPGELILVLVLYMAALGARGGFWRPPLLSKPGVSFVPRSMRSSGLIFLMLRHLSTLAVGYRILGFLYGAALWYSTKTLAHVRGANQSRGPVTPHPVPLMSYPWAQSGSPYRAQSTRLLCTVGTRI
jgi:hypothetical protein